MFNRSTRQDIFSAFWATGNKESQSSFILSMVDEEEPTSQRRKESIKQHNVVRQYHMQKEGARHRVCKTFFMSTLDVSATTITTALRNSKLGFAEKDRRGKHTPSTKTSQSDKDFVCKHIRSFPKMKPHYNRHDSTRDYLDAKLNLKIMYGLYVQFCKEHCREPVKEPIYRRVFHSDFNLAFHKPKKDTCIVCDKYEHGSILYDEYNAHIRHKLMHSKKTPWTRQGQRLTLNFIQHVLTWNKFCQHQAHLQALFSINESWLSIICQYIRLDLAVETVFCGTRRKEIGVPMKLAPL